MGMHIGSSYASMGAQSMSGTSIWQQRQQSMGALKSALQSGDLSSAQSAFASISAKMPNIDPNSPLGQIGQALQTGDIASATKISSSWKSHTRLEGAKDQAYSSQATTDPSSSFAAALINSLTQTGLINASNAVTASSSTSSAGASTSAATSGSAASAPSSLDPAVAQSLSTFMQNLFATLQAQAGAQPTALSPTTPSSAQGAAAVTSSSASSATQVASQTSASSTGLTPSTNPTGAPSSGPVRHGHHGGGHHHYSEGASSSQLSANLQSLISQLGAANSTSTDLSSASATSPSASTDALAQLQQSFNNLSTATGSSTSSNGANNTLAAFLQNLSQNLQSMGTSGSLLNISA